MNALMNDARKVRRIKEEVFKHDYSHSKLRLVIFSRYACPKVLFKEPAMHLEVCIILHGAQSPTIKVRSKVIR